MLKHFEREVVRLKEQIVQLGQLTEEQVKTAFRAVIERDTALAETVIEGDDKIDHREVELEEECLKLLALHQPVAVDLRFIVSVLKINNDLERIGDLAVDIARRAIRLNDFSPVVIPDELEKQAKAAKLMLRKALLSLIEMDGSIARDVLATYRKLEEFNKTACAQLLGGVKSKPDAAEESVLVIAVARRLERVGDLAANIAEDVVYMVEGEIIRHGRDRIAP